jgi:hypothetical protein
LSSALRSAYYASSCVQIYMCKYPHMNTYVYVCICIYLVISARAVPFCDTAFKCNKEDYLFLCDTAFRTIRMLLCMRVSYTCAYVYVCRYMYDVYIIFFTLPSAHCAHATTHATVQEFRMSKVRLTTQAINHPNTYVI